LSPGRSLLHISEYFISLWNQYTVGKLVTNAIPSELWILLPERLDEVFMSTQNTIESFRLIKILRPIWVNQEMVILIFFTHTLWKRMRSAIALEKNVLDLPGHRL